MQLVVSFVYHTLVCLVSPVSSTHLITEGSKNNNNNKVNLLDYFLVSEARACE